MPQALLSRICDAYYLPDWCSISRYCALAEELQLEGIKTADWSLEVQPFWRAVIDSALTWRARGCARARGQCVR
jgi:tocopherol O-methyltransferase